jgi:hypothetical protein
MMTEKDISERNGFLISLISELQLGIHIVELPHKPKFLSHDSKLLLKCYVHNFNMILNDSDDNVFYQFKLKETSKLNIDEIRDKFIDWLTSVEHTKVYTITLKDTGLFVTGFNHHNKILKKNPYPVFARYSPIVYYDMDRAEGLLHKFSDYELIINK